MKKLNLKLGSIKETLTREQMKKITGGYEDACCTCKCLYIWEDEFFFLRTTIIDAYQVPCDEDYGYCEWYCDEVYSGATGSLIWFTC